jgi:hypothetical protein
MANRRHVRTVGPIKALLAGVAVALSFAGCDALPLTLYGKRISGQVVDADTGLPIGGAHVAFLWEAPVVPKDFSGHVSRTICYHAAAAAADSRGRFHIEPWTQWRTLDVRNAEATGAVYAPGYVPLEVLPETGPIKPPAERLNEAYRLKRFDGTADQRIETLRRVAASSCDYGGESRRSLYPIMKAIYDEARQVAQTPEQLATLRVLAEIAAEAAIAPDPQGPTDSARIDAFIRERLK